MQRQGTRQGRSVAGRDLDPSLATLFLYNPNVVVVVVQGGGCTDPAGHPQVHRQAGGQDPHHPQVRCVTS